MTVEFFYCFILCQALYYTLLMHCLTLPLPQTYPLYIDEETEVQRSN